jgi:hypothetical protein
MTKVLLSRHTDATPLMSVFLTHSHRGDSAGMAQFFFTLTSGVTGFLVLAFIGALLNGEHSAAVLCGLSAVVPLAVFYGMRTIALGIGRRWRSHGQRADRDWLAWVERARAARSTDELPLIPSGSLTQGCLTAHLPKSGRADQYEFTEPSHAAHFLDRHRELIVKRLRFSFSNQQGGQRLAMGVLENKDHHCLLLYRQFIDECALYFAVAHRRNGTVVNLVTQRWTLFNRDASPEEGRKRSDEEVAAKRGLPDREKWRARPEWGALGYWHLVDYICHRLGGEAESPIPETAASDSELDYYEKIVHVETVKDALQRPSAALPQSQDSASHHAESREEGFL